MIGTKLIVEVNITADSGVVPDYSLDFYIERGGNSISYTSKELIRIETAEGTKFYALVDSSLLGRGALMCRVIMQDNEPLYSNRPVVFSVFTGITLGGCTCSSGQVTRCGDYELGFGLVDDVPKDINARIYIGVIKDWVTGYEYITEEMIQGVLTEFPVGAVETNINVVMGDKVVTLIPCNEHLTARKGDGFGGKVSFGGFMSSNGEIVLRVNGIECYVYGEMMTVNGEIEIFVN